MSDLAIEPEHDAEPPPGPWATFLLDGETFAVSVDQVQEVLMPQILAPVPLAPPQVLGLLNLRGRLMPAIDLRIRLGRPPHDPSRAATQLVIETPEGPIGLVVDDIGDVLALPAHGWRPPPDTLSRQQRRFVFGVFPVHGRLVIGLRTAELGFDGDSDEVAG